MNRKILKKIILGGLVAGSVCGAFFYLSEPISLLSMNDFTLELEDSSNRELGSAIGDPNPWESFNRWQCFKLPRTTLECSLLDQKFPVPEIVLENKGKLFIFSLDYGETYDCQALLGKWRPLLQDARKACFYGAYLPTDRKLDERKNQTPLFVVSRFKSDRGEWRLNEDSPTD